MTVKNNRRRVGKTPVVSMRAVVLGEIAATPAGALDADTIIARVRIATSEPAVLAQSVRNCLSDLRKHRHLVTERAEHVGRGWRMLYLITPEGRAALAAATPSHRRPGVVRLNRRRAQETSEAARTRSEAARRAELARSACERVTGARLPLQRHAARQIVGVCGRLAIEAQDDTDKQA